MTTPIRFAKDRWGRAIGCPYVWQAAASRLASTSSSTIHPTPGISTCCLGLSSGVVLHLGISAASTRGAAVARSPSRCQRVEGHSVLHATASWAATISRSSSWVMRRARCLSPSFTCSPRLLLPRLPRRHPPIRHPLLRPRLQTGQRRPAPRRRRTTHP